MLGFFFFNITWFFGWFLGGVELLFICDFLGGSVVCSYGFSFFLVCWGYVVKSDSMDYYVFT